MVGVRRVKAVAALGVALAVCLAAMSLAVNWVYVAAGDDGSGASDAEAGEQTGGGDSGSDGISDALREDLLHVAAKEGISFETAKRNWETQQLLLPYINRVEAERVKDFAGFWWSDSQPLTATFATSGDVKEFSEFLDVVMADLDAKVRGIVRVVEADRSYEDLRLLRTKIADAMRDDGHIFDSDIDVRNGVVHLITPAEQFDGLSAAVGVLLELEAELSTLEAEVLTQAVRVKTGGLAQPSSGGFGGTKSGREWQKLLNFFRCTQYREFQFDGRPVGRPLPKREYEHNYHTGG